MKRREQRWLLSQSKKRYKAMCDEDPQLINLREELLKLQAELALLHPLIFTKVFYKSPGDELRGKYREVSTRVHSTRSLIQEREAVLKLVCGLGVQGV
jgi:hypothetical protein